MHLKLKHPSRLNSHQMKVKATTTIPHCLLLLFMLTLIPAPSAAVSGNVHDVLRTLQASGLVPKLHDLSMYKIGTKNDGGSMTYSGHNMNKNENERLESALIANGEDAIPKQFTSQAAILINTSMGLYQICGGALISERHVLTAAHCLPYMTGNKNFTYDHFIGVGMLDLDDGLSNPGSQIVKVADYLIHEGYRPDKSGYPNDLAILYLETAIVNNTYVQFAELATPEMGNFAKTYCTVSGWGLMQEKEETTMLQWGFQYIPTLGDCKNFWSVSRKARIAKRHICGYFYPVSACSGDSGGALMCGNVLAGIVSWGLQNCSGCFPSVYTRISFHYKWILYAMSNHFY